MVRKVGSPGTASSELFRTGRNEDYVSKHFDRWRELAALCLREQDPAKLTELAHEINFVLAQKTPHLDPPQQAPKFHEEGQRDARQPHAFEVGTDDEACDSEKSASTKLPRPATFPRNSVWRSTTVRSSK